MKANLPDPLTREEEYRLAMILVKARKDKRVPRSTFQRILKRKECLEAFNKLVEHNIRFVIKLAESYKSIGIEDADVIQEGVIGLMRSIEYFDPRKSKLTTYSSFMIRRYCKEALHRLSRTIRQPTHANEAVFKIETAKRNLFEKFGDEPSEEDLQKETGLSPFLVKRFKNGTTPMFSLDTLIKSNGNKDFPISDVIVDPNGVQADNEAELNDSTDWALTAISQLTLREQDIICSYFGIKQNSQTLQQIGDRYKITRERVRQLLEMAKSRVRFLLNQKDKDVPMPSIYYRHLYHGPEKEQQVRDRLREGWSKSEVSVSTGMPMPSISRIHKIMKEKNMVLLCGCGQDAEHKGWCKARVKRHEFDYKSYHGTIGSVEEMRKAA